MGMFIDKEDAIKHDINVLGKFISIYCTGKHYDREKKPFHSSGKIASYMNTLHVIVCDDCKKLLRYAASKRIICPYTPKPACKDCAAHCYAEPNRNKIREIMRYSGIRQILKGGMSNIKKFL